MLQLPPPSLARELHSIPTMRERVSIRLRQDQRDWLTGLDSSLPAAVERAVLAAGEPPDIRGESTLAPVSVRLSDAARRVMDRWGLAYGSTSRGVRAMLDAARARNGGLSTDEDGGVHNRGRGDRDGA